MSTITRAFIFFSLAAVPILGSPINYDNPPLPDISLNYVSLAVGQQCRGTTYALSGSAKNGTVQLTVSACESGLCYGAGDQPYLCRTLDDQNYRYVTRKNSCGFSDLGVILIERCKDGFDCVMNTPLKGTCVPSPSPDQSNPSPPEFTVLPSNYNAKLGENCRNILDPVGRILQHVTCGAGGLWCNNLSNVCEQAFSPVKRVVAENLCGYIKDSNGGQIIDCPRFFKCVFANDADLTGECKFLADNTGL
ncbi:hypothetical protein HDU97_002990 [Phlyctochytrium planicorne]|nr:hypothetical protein HDU97_002990 [Phlyctochytrium planicorne]